VKAVVLFAHRRTRGINECFKRKEGTETKHELAGLCSGCIRFGNGSLRAGADA
jgi:hypothetical protein